MRVVDAIRRSGVGVGTDATIRQAAIIMERSGVGALAVIDGTDLVGVVTDRDLVRRGLAADRPPDSRVDAVMSSPVVTIDAEADLHQAFAVFRTNGIRRLAVTRKQEFVGMVTIDDLLINLAADLSDLARPITAEVLFGHHEVPLPAER